MGLDNDFGDRGYAGPRARQKVVDYFNKLHATENRNPLLNMPVRRWELFPAEFRTDERDQVFTQGDWSPDTGETPNPDEVRPTKLHSLLNNPKIEDGVRRIRNVALATFAIIAGSVFANHLIEETGRTPPRRKAEPALVSPDDQVSEPLSEEEDEFLDGTYIHR